MLMKNGQTADPLNKFAKASKEVSGKRKKTDADYLELQRIDFLGALYMNQNGPCIPGRVLEAAIIAGAKKSKNGPAAKAGIYCDGNFDLDYEGPREPDQLFQDDNFRDVQPVKVGQAKVMRCRPKFNEWGFTAKINYDDSLCNEKQVIGWAQDAGIQCGIGDYRPRHGRFEVTKI
ncbi:MAG: hypothetical protein L0287_36640 [Anaerolineae bacterium]|nr:hypothetical protein [Anaerolineae bacterium]